MLRNIITVVGKKSGSCSGLVSTRLPAAAAATRPLVNGQVLMCSSKSGDGGSQEGDAGIGLAEDASHTSSPKYGSEKSVNSVTLLGRVGINPQLRGTESHPVVAFSLATSMTYRPGGYGSNSDLVTKTEWHNVACFKPKLRESVHEHVAKGNRVMVQGRIMYGSVEDKMGVIRQTTTIVAEDIIRFADSKGK